MFKIKLKSMNEQYKYHGGRWEYNPSIRRFREALERLIHENLRGEHAPQKWSRPFPQVDVSETERRIIITANLPGMKEEEIDIGVDEDEIEICGCMEKEKEESEEGKRFHRYEREYGEFYRRIPLPARIIPEETTAEIKEGVLKIMAPKAQPERKERMRVIKPEK